MEDFERELKVGFLEEASQALADVEQCFLELERNPGDPENLNKIFRLAHNLKGSSRAVGFDEMGLFTHAFESFILRIKNGELAPTKNAVNLLLRANDHIRSMVESYKSDLSATIGSSALVPEMEGFVDGAEALSEPPPQESAATAPSPAFDDSPVTLEPTSDPPQASVPEAAPRKPAMSRASAGTDESIRVALAKVEKLIDHIGEMVILQNVLQEQTKDISSPLVRKSFNQLGKVGKEIQDLAMSLRMVPIKPTFQKMQRIVRDTAAALDKDVRLKMIGEETELDKTVLELINDPLVHLIRNSIDHGVESKQRRREAGKPEAGEVTISAVHKAGRLVLEVRDDGAGLDPEKLTRKAIEKGLIKPDAVLSEREAFQLIFAAGFSTKEQVTDVSGRGVGMDVVRTNIQELGGDIQIESSLGKGTSFQIFLPLTLAIIDAMIVKFGPQRFVLPLSHLHETLQPKSGMVRESTSLGDVLMLRNEHMPLFRLGDFFGLRSALPPEQMTAMIIRTTEQPFALLVDQIVNQQQVVVKQLSNDLASLRGSSGTTILGDGKPSLILEPNELLKRKAQRPPPLQGAA